MTESGWKSGWEVGDSGSEAILGPRHFLAANGDGESAEFYL